MGYGCTVVVLFPSNTCKHKNIEYDEEYLSQIYDSYAKSAPKNKLVYGEQVYPLLEIALHNIVNGDDIKEQLTSVDDYMKKQLN